MVLVVDSPALRPDRPYNPDVHAHRFGLFRVRSPLLAESLICFLFLQVLRWFTSLGCLRPTYGFGRRSSGMSLSGLPHSEILGSKPVCGSPKLFAAYHVLHRLLAPRHSPYALSSLTIKTGTNACLRPKPRPCDSSLHTAMCVSASARLRKRRQNLWSEKTTVCRIFSCQRSSGGIRPSEFLSVVLGTTSPGPPRSLHSRGPKAPLRSARVNLLNRHSTLVAGVSGEAGPRAPAERKRRRRLPTRQSGEYRARTGDLLVANQALSQLS